ncbi:MAG: hypothetical protein JNM96_05090, partial [Bacteroidia bacterium]|nr:hypothetical protein [Bacteroidia bacterium]
MSLNLIQLVKTLTKSEKRYIHLNLKTFSFDENTNQFLADFNKVEHYVGLKKQAKTLTLEGNSTKLYYKILDILFQLLKENLYDNENDNRLIKRSQVLFHKGFYQEGIKQLNKVIYTEKDFSYLLRIEAIELKIRAAIKFSDIDYLNKNFESDKLLLIDFSNYYFNQLEFESIWALVKAESSTTYFIGQDNDFIKRYQVLLQDEKYALGPAAKIFYNKIKGFLAIKEGKFETALGFAKRTKSLYVLNEEIKNRNLGEYLRSIRNLCIAYIHLEQYDKAEVLLNETEQEARENKKWKVSLLKNDLFTLFVSLRMDLIIYSGAINKNQSRFNFFESEIKNNEEYLGADEKLTALFQLCYFYLYTQNYKKALRTFNKAIVIPDNVRKDLRQLLLLCE